MAPKSGEISLVDDKEFSPRDTSLSADENDDLWTNILKGVASSKIVPTKNLLILGDKESGKSTFIRHLKGEEVEEDFEVPNSNGTMSKSVGTGTDESSPSDNKRLNPNDLALSYTFVEVKDDEADTLARLGIYQLAGSHESYQSLLRFALNSSTLPDSLVVIVLDWARPWTFIETLQRWIKFLEAGIENIKSEGDVGAKDGWTKGKAVIDELKESIVKFVQNYAEPDSNNPNPTVNSENDDDVALPLDEGVLTTNLAIPLVVVCTKSDNVSNLERELDYKEEQFDYIQQCLRTICLKYGAALFYTNTHAPQTFDTLRQYILHRLLGTKSLSSDTKSAYAFNIKANYVERDTVLVPAGWDSWRKIKFLKEGFDCEELIQGWNLDLSGKSDTSEEGGDNISARKVYEEIIDHEDSDKPLSVQTPIEAEDEQAFFARHFDTLQKANNERLTPPSVVGPMGAPSYPYGDIGAEVPDLDNTPIAHTSINNNVPSSRQIKPNVTPKVPQSSAVNPPNGIPADAAATNGAPSSNTSQNEVLANFFQNLLSKKNVPTSSRTPQSPNDSVTNPVAKPTNEMVEKELDKLRNLPTASMAGK